jgi:hypothetical protein
MAMEAAATSNALRRQYGDDVAEQSMRSMTSLHESPLTRYLAAAYESDKGARAKIDSALKSGDTSGLWDIARSAHRNRQTREHAQSADTRSFVSRMYATNPDAFRSLLRTKAENLGGQSAKQLRAVLSNPGEVARRLRDRDFTGLSANEANLLREHGGVALPGASGVSPLPLWARPQRGTLPAQRAARVEQREAQREARLGQRRARLEQRLADRQSAIDQRAARWHERQTGQALPSQFGALTLPEAPEVGA